MVTDQGVMMTIPILMNYLMLYRNQNYERKMLACLIFIGLGLALIQLAPYQDSLAPIMVCVIGIILWVFTYISRR